MERILQKHESKAISKIAARTPKKMTMPIMTCLLVRFNDSGIEVTSSDLDSVIKYSSGTCSLGTISVVIRANDWKNYSAMLKGDLVTLDYQDGKLLINGIACETIDPAEYPNVIPVPNETEPLSMVAAELVEAIEIVRGAMSSDQTRFCLNGIHIKASDKGGYCEATDGHRAHRAAISYTMGKVDLIVPSFALPWIDTLASIGPVDSALVYKTSNGDRLKLSVIDGSYPAPQITELWVRPIDGHFPDTDMVINQARSIGTLVTIPAESKALLVKELTATSKALPSKKGNDQGVKVRVSDGVCRVEASLPFGAERNVNLSPEVQGKSVLIGLNCAYLIDALKSIGGDLRLEFAGELAPVMMIGGSLHREQRAVMMPMRLR